MNNPSQLQPLPRERERERERVETAESKHVRQLAIINLLLILTVAFLVKVVFDLNRSLENPPQQSGSFVLPSSESVKAAR